MKGKDKNLKRRLAMRASWIAATLVVTGGVAIGSTVLADCPGKPGSKLTAGSDLKKFYDCLCKIIDGDPTATPPVAPCLPADVTKELQRLKKAGKLRVGTKHQIECDLAEQGVASLRRIQELAEQMDMSKQIADELKIKKEEAKKTASANGLAGKDCVTIIAHEWMSNPYIKKATLIHEATHVIHQRQKNWIDPEAGGSGGGPGGASAPAKETPGWKDYQEIGCESAALTFLLDQAKKNDAAPPSTEKEEKKKQLKAAIGNSKGTLLVFWASLCGHKNSPHYPTYKKCKESALALIAKADVWLSQFDK